MARAAVGLAYLYCCVLLDGLFLLDQHLNQPLLSERLDLEQLRVVDSDVALGAQDDDERDDRGDNPDQSLGQPTREPGSGAARAVLQGRPRLVARVRVVAREHCSGGGVGWTSGPERVRCAVCATPSGASPIDWTRRVLMLESEANNGQR